MELNIQRLLREGVSLADLEALYAINANRHLLHPNLVGLKYNHVASPDGDAVVNECRGIILDEANHWEVVCRGFDRFFNELEPHAAVITWKTARVQKKCDGSLILLYHYAGRWHAATTGMPDASGEVGDHHRTFADLFWETFSWYRSSSAPGFLCPILTIDAAEMPSKVEWENTSFLLELTTPLNRVVVPHVQPTLTLLAARDRRTGEWKDASRLARLLGVPLVEEYPLRSREEALAFLITLNGFENEGFVIVDGKHNRVKMKHPDYVRAHHLLTGGESSRKALLQIALSGEGAEVCAYFPDIAARLAQIEAICEKWTHDVSVEYASIAHLADQKEFAASAVKMLFPAALFALRAGKASDPRDYLRKLPLPSAIKLLGLKTDENTAVATVVTDAPERR